MNLRLNFSYQNMGFDTEFHWFYIRFELLIPNFFVFWYPIYLINLIVIFFQMFSFDLITFYLISISLIVFHTKKCQLNDMSLWYSLWCCSIVMFIGISMFMLMLFMFIAILMSFIVDVMLVFRMMLSYAILLILWMY